MPLVLPASFLLKSVSASLCECVCVWDGSEFSARGLTFAACSGVSCSQQSLSNPTQAALVGAFHSFLADFAQGLHLTQEQEGRKCHVDAKTGLAYITTTLTTTFSFRWAGRPWLENGWYGVGFTLRRLLDIITEYTTKMGRKSHVALGKMPTRNFEKFPIASQNCKCLKVCTEFNS